ncbi:MAG: hypothetical protein MUF34_04675 [Polyangiaceae bacterium]|nr:hypothetical protein [Polyangiaceae bacterium]
MSGSPPMAPLQIADLDLERLRDLFADVAALGEGLTIVLKRAAAEAADAGGRASLDEALEGLRRGSVVGVQLCYGFQGALWRDTLLRTPAGFRLVRAGPPAPACSQPSTVGTISCRTEGGLPPSSSAGQPAVSQGS